MLIPIPKYAAEKAQRYTLQSLLIGFTDAYYFDITPFSKLPSLFMPAKNPPRCVLTAVTPSYPPFPPPLNSTLL